MKRPLYFDDFEVGQRIATESVTVSKEEAVAFAREYDPQYFHVDEQGAQGSPFGRLIVSGWQTAAVTMRLKAATELTQVAGGLIGLGIESLRWPRPTYPGDTLRAVIVILEKRPSQSRPTHGVVKYKVETFNQENALVMEMVTAVWVPLR